MRLTLCSFLYWEPLKMFLRLVMPKSITGIFEIYNQYFYYWSEFYWMSRILLKIPHRFTKSDEDPIIRTKLIVPPVDILQISAGRSTDLPCVDWFFVAFFLSKWLKFFNCDVFLLRSQNCFLQEIQQLDDCSELKHTVCKFFCSCLFSAYNKAAMCRGHFTEVWKIMKCVCFS